MLTRTIEEQARRLKILAECVQNHFWIDPEGKCITPFTTLTLEMFDCGAIRVNPEHAKKLNCSVDDLVAIARDFFAVGPQVVWSRHCATSDVSPTNSKRRSTDTILLIDMQYDFLPVAQRAS